MTHQHNCVLTKFNFVNNTGPDEYFRLYSGNHKKVKELMIVFKPTNSLKWLYASTNISVTLSINGCFAVASGTFQRDAKVILIAGTAPTASAPTNTPFHPQIDNKSY